VAVRTEAFSGRPCPERSAAEDQSAPHVEHRWFLSYHSPDHELAEKLRSALERREQRAKVFFAPRDMEKGGVWPPQLAAEIERSTAFILLVAEHGFGSWQEFEYFEALAKNRKDPQAKRYPIVLVLIEGQEAPGLPFLRLFHSMTTADPTTELEAGSLVQALINPRAPARKAWRYTSPYRGLAAMTEKDSDYFFGRDQEVVQVLEVLAHSTRRMPVLLGNSGVGKSSLAQAGVLGCLKREAWPERAGTQGIWPEPLRHSRRWCFLAMRPGKQPVKALVREIFDRWQFRAADADRFVKENAWLGRLRDGQLTLADLLVASEKRYTEELGQEHPPAYFLYVDQGEELFRSEESERRRFTELLEQAITDQRLRVLMSLRADSLGLLQNDQHLYSVHYKIDVPPLRFEQLQQVISGPAELLEAEFDPPELATDIALRVAEDSIKDTGALPLLSYLLEDMWNEMQRREDGKLRLARQAVELGGVLVSRAEEFLRRYPHSEADLRRVLTVKLATVREDGEAYRRRALRSEFSDTEWQLVGKLADEPYRLLVTALRDGSETHAEVAHEAVFRRWQRLREWVKEQSEFLIWKNHLESDRRRWEKTPEPVRQDSLLTGFPLGQAQHWLETKSAEIADVDQNFIRLSEEHAASEEEHRERLRNDALLMHSRLLADLAMQSIRSGDACTGMLLAMEALPNGNSGGIDRPYSADAELALFTGAQHLLERAVFNSHRESVQSATFSPDGCRILTASTDHTARICNIVQPAVAAFEDSGKEIILHHARPVRSACFSSNGCHVVTASADETARVWDAKSGTEKLVLPHANRVTRALFSPDGSRILTAAEDSTPRLWISPDSATEIWNASNESITSIVLRGHQDRVTDVQFCCHGKLVLAGSADKTARIWNAQTGALLHTFTGHEAAVTVARFSADNAQVITGSEDHTARIWNVATGTSIVLRGHTGAIRSAALSKDGQFAITAGDDTTARLWRIHTGLQVAVLNGHENKVVSAMFSDDGQTILTASADQTVRLWDVAGKPIVLRGHDDAVTNAIFSPDGNYVLSGSVDKTARLWNTRPQATGRLVAQHNTAITSAAVSQDRRYLLTASQDRTARLWDAERGLQRGELSGHRGSVNWAVLGRAQPTHENSSSPGIPAALPMIATASSDNTVRLWGACGEEKQIRGHTGRVLHVELSSDGEHLVTASSDGTTRIWSCVTGAETAKLPHEKPVNSAVFSADGRYVLTACDDRIVRLWEVNTREVREFRGHDSAVKSARFRGDERLLVTASADSTARLWEASTAAPVAILREENSPVNFAEFSPDGQRVLTACGDGVARIWAKERDGASKQVWKRVAELKGHSVQLSVARFTSDGHGVVTASYDGRAKFWAVFPTTDALLQYAKAHVPRGLTSKTRQKAFLDVEE
jgi:WD40 repeat protein